MGTAFASDVGAVMDTDNSNLMIGDDSSLSTNLELSSNSVSDVNVYENNQDADSNLLGAPATVNKTHLNSSDLKMYYMDGSMFNVTLLDENNNPLANQEVIFSIDGLTKNYTKITNDDGVASLTIRLYYDNYVIKSYFLGNGSYAASNVTNTIAVVHRTIEAQDLVKTYQNDTQYQVTCADFDGNLLVNSLVNINIIGKDYSRYTNEKGVATLNINLEPGDYIVTATNTVTNTSITNNITVLSSIESNDLVKYFKNGSAFEATFFNKQGTPLKNTNIQFNIVGKTYTKTTDGNGVAKLNINLNPGNYVVTSINPVTNEKVSNNIVVLNVIETKDLVKYYRNGSQFNAKILDDEGRPLQGAQVSFNIVGKTYTKTTDGNGVATLNINLGPGDYTITSTYNGLTNTNKIKVITGETKLNVPEQYVYSREPGKFNATLTYANGEPIANQKVTFTVLGKTYERTTDSNGVARLDCRLSAGDYPVTVKFAASGFKSCQATNTLHEVDSLVLILCDNQEVTYKSGSTFNATLVNIKDRTPIANDTIVFNIVGKNYSRVTDSNGVARLNINLEPGVYPVTVSHTGPQQDFSKKVSVTVIKREAIVEANNLYKLYKSSEKYNASFYDWDNNPLVGYQVNLNIVGKTYTKTTDENGTVYLNINLVTGNYTLSYSLVNHPYYQANGQSIVFVNGTNFIAENIVLEAGSSGTFPVQIVDPDNNPVAGIPVTFSINKGKDVQTVVTDENGIAAAKLNGYQPGVYNVDFTYVDFNGDNKAGSYSFKVKHPITVKDVIQASIALRNYIEGNYKLPGVVTVGDDSMNIASYYYLACEALVSMQKNYFGVITYKFIDEPANPGSATYLGDLYTYIDVAQRSIQQMDNTGVAPATISSDVGNIGYDGLIYAMCRAVAFYDSHDRLPHYTVVKSFGSPVIPGVLNQKNTIADLAPYLAATLHCQVNDPAIQNLARQLTSGKTSDYAKAVAIYNFVRDSVSYSFYYNTHKGATGTLSARSGNCCDQAHLVIALSRAAGLPARYNHASCTFSSGSTYGHVYAQVLVGDTWYVADPTSTRNSFGVVKNWNNYSYKLHGQYASLSF